MTTTELITLCQANGIKPRGVLKALGIPLNTWRQWKRRGVPENFANGIKFAQKLKPINP